LIHLNLSHLIISTAERMDIDTSLFSSFIAENVRNNTPFALFLMSNHPHGNSWPRRLGDESLFDADKLVLPPHFIDTPETREKYVKYLAAMNYLDQEVGMVIQTLKNHGVYDENTLVMFASEQGHSWPFAKWTLYSEGLQSALIARWPGRIEAGTTTNAMVEYVDFTPTMDRSCWW
jgi:N-sulfoglucosamine sulfohydrolase